MCWKVDRSFYCNIDRPGVVIPGSAHLDLLKDGRIFVSGTFSSVDDLPRPGYAMLHSDGRIDQSFEPWRGRTNVSGRTFLPGGTFRAAALANGSVAVMSDSIEGQRAPYPLTAYLLDPSGTWIQRKLTNAPAVDWGYPPGLILTLGWGGFWARSPVDWSSWTELKRQYWMPLGSDRPPIVDLPFWLWQGQPTAAQAAVVFRALFEEVPMELCKYAVRMPDGGSIIAVSEGTPLRTRARLMRFDKDWHPIPDFSTQFEADYRRSLRLKRTSDGKFLLAGAETIDGSGFPGLVRLDEHGALDRSFLCVTTNGPSSMVYDAAVQSDGRVVICGDFTRVNDAPARFLARLNPDGTLDSTFKAPFVQLSEIQRQRSIRIARLSKLRKGSGQPDPGASDSALSETVQILRMERDAGRAAIHFKGKPRQLYILQAQEPATPNKWINVNSVEARPDGTGVLNDPGSMQHPLRFYRVVTP